MSFHYGQQGYPGGPGGGHNPHLGGTYGAASGPYRPPPSAPYASGSPYGGYGAPGQGSPYAQPRPGGAPGGPYGAGSAPGGPYGVGYGGGQPQGGAYRHPGPTAGHAPHGVNPEAYQWFQTVDTDRSGSITLKELRQALVNSNWSAFNDETCLMMINMFDRTRMGRIDVSGFSALWDFLQQWRALFQQYDRDRSGCISSTELHQALAQMGYNLSPQFTETLVGRFNVRGGGRPGMQLDRFIQVCTQLQSMTQAFREKDSAMTGNIRLSYEDFLCGAVTRLM